MGTQGLLRATLDEVPKSRVQRNRPFLLAESHKLDENLWSESGKSRLNLHGTILEEKSIGSDSQKKKRAKLESSWFEEPTCKLGSPKQGPTGAKLLASNESKLVPTNLEHGPPI
jgi:hypothetical protein